MDDALRKDGEAVRRRVLGDDYVDRAKAGADAFSAPLQDLLNEYCWGMAWTDDGLDLKQRSLLNLGMLAASNRMHEFGIHFRGAMRNGLSDRELQAALLQDRDLLRRTGGRRGVPGGPGHSRGNGRGGHGLISVISMKPGATRCLGTPEDGKGR
jgi:4-carboxymuconolactone decarboxylase